MNQKVVMLLGGIFLVVVVIGVILVVSGIIKNPFQNIPLLQKGPKVEVKTTYKNPFDKGTQFVNPFDKYKNPFVTNR